MKEWSEYTKEVRSYDLTLVRAYFDRTYFAYSGFLIDLVSEFDPTVIRDIVSYHEGIADTYFWVPTCKVHMTIKILGSAGMKDASSVGRKSFLGNNRSAGSFSITIS
jgi:hypothetical protein